MVMEGYRLEPESRVLKEDVIVLQWWNRELQNKLIDLEKAAFTSCAWSC
jgi:hypothetical protein